MCCSKSANSFCFGVKAQRAFGNLRFSARWFAESGVSGHALGVKTTTTHARRSISFHRTRVCPPFSAISFFFGVIILKQGQILARMSWGRGGSCPCHWTNRDKLYCFPLGKPLCHALASERHKEQNKIQIFTSSRAT